MSTAVSASMQAALLIREKQRLRRKKFRKGRSELPSHVATKDIAPFPQYPPGFWCSQGRAAWQERERGRRCSLSEEARQHRLKQTEAHHRWMKRNRIHDTTYGGSSDEEDFFNVYHQSAAANALLYVGLGTVAIGSVIFFVGTGEKGFKTLELRLIGPTLIACGLLCCLVRVLLCACPSTCIRRRKKTRLKNSLCPHGGSNSNAARYPPSLNRVRDKTKDFVPLERTCSNRNAKKKVCIAPGNNDDSNPLPSTSTTNFRESMAAVAAAATETTATTSLLLAREDDEEVPLTKPSIPIITVPDFADFDDDVGNVAGSMRRDDDDSLIELQNLDVHYELQSVSSCDSDTVVEIETRKTSKHVRTREPNVRDAEQSTTLTMVDIDAIEDVETCLSVVIERNEDGGSVGGGNNSYNSERHSEKTAERNDRGDSSDKLSHSGIVLSPLQLGQ